ncbi:PREDICTED: 39S ribosomal protein L33, mitochondrial isoform X1 [Capra hircus]|uniref:39S ribosomal protein L33, mitochondrial isoform X1 n=1 Tax=Capra hircus TaxID=9925 RepID=UPI0008463840|nr:PREDICTED: 39S ribosomal protein L33, mitochondrial isoform X1 [Capra hircus]
MPRGRAPCGASGSWGSSAQILGPFRLVRTVRVWLAEVGLSLALCSGVSAESLDVLTEKTSEFLVHSFRVLKLPRASQKQFW